MSRIDELIEQMCPDGVLYKPIKMVYRRLKGTPITAGKMKEIADPDGEIKIFAGGQTMIFAHEKDIPRANITRVPAVLVQSRGIIDFVYYDQPFTFKNEMWAYTADDNTSVKFLYHVLKANAEAFRNAASGMGSMPQISLKVTEDFKVPIPPMEIQQEIVRVLDSFTELEARHRQYDYYRDRLFADCDSIEWVSLLDLAKDCDRARKPIKQEDRIPGDTPYYGASGIVDHVDGFTHEGDYLLVSEDGANLVARTYPIAFQIHGRNWVNNHAHVLQINNEKERKLVEIYLNSISLEPYISKGAQPKLTKKKLGDIKVPVPSEADLARIVGILEKFDVLTTDISQGLPAEIDARRQQYAYYRDKLLTFKEKVA